MQTFNVTSETADAIRAAGIRMGMTPAAPQPVAPGIESVTLTPFAALKFTSILAEHGGDANKAAASIASAA